MRSLYRIAYAIDVEEEESGLRGMRFDCVGAESRAINFRSLLLCLLVLIATGNREWRGASRISAADVNVRNPAHDVVGGERIELGSA